MSKNGRLHDRDWLTDRRPRSGIVDRNNPHLMLWKLIADGAWVVRRRRGICCHAAAVLCDGLAGMKMESSSNVFAEDLHSTRNLEATYYVTDTTQASDFYWDRESGLRVNIGILNMHLIPEYR